MAISPEKIWIKFFTNAGLPPGISATYALTFTENRIQMNMLLDLNKEYLREMGIVCMGDVIAILRHAKQVHEETARDRILDKTNPKVVVEPLKILDKSKSTISSTLADKNSNPPSRIVATKRKFNAVEPKINTEMKFEECAPIKVQRISLRHKDTRSELRSTTENTISPEKKLTDVFSRLGTNNEPQSKIEIIKNASQMDPSRQKNVFERLGGKASDTSTPLINNNSVDKTVPVGGILKNQIVIRTNGKTRMLNKISSDGTMQADKTPVSIREKLSIPLPQRKSVKFSPLVDYKLIESRSVNKPIQASAMTGRLLAHSKVDNVKTPIKNSANLKGNVKLRLGSVNLRPCPQLNLNSNVNPIIENMHLRSTNNGVFSRLGLKRKVL